MATEGELRVWHIPQVPGKPFHVPVIDVAMAMKILDALADYDNFQFQNRIKPDYCNASGLEIFENGAWVEWESADGDDVNSLMKVA